MIEYRIRLSEETRKLLYEILAYFPAVPRFGSTDIARIRRFAFRLKRLPYITNKEASDAPELGSDVGPKEGPSDS